MKFAFAYITTAGRAEARALGQRLIEARLAACVNIIDGMESIYRWDGKIESANEAILIVKTAREKEAALLECVREHHGYDVPCGNPAYLKWLGENL